MVSLAKETAGDREGCKAIWTGFTSFPVLFIKVKIVRIQLI